MNNSFVYKNERPWPNPRLKRAAIVGHVTETSVRLWFRMAAPGNYKLLVYPAPTGDKDSVFAGFKKVPYKGIESLQWEPEPIDFEIPDFSRDTTSMQEVTGLKPATEYRYAVYGEEDGVLRILLGQDKPYRFRTLPAEKNASLSFAFYSCHMPYKKSLFGSTNISNMEMWDCLNAVMERHYKEDFRFLIGGGDQVYADGIDTLDIWKYLNRCMHRKNGQLYPGKDEMISWYRDIYRGYWGFPSLRKAYARFPTYMIWDDHEFGDGWGSFLFGGKDDELHELFPDFKSKKLSRKDCLELMVRMKEAAIQVYEEYQHCHNPQTEPGQFDFSIAHQSTSVYFLDGRGYRDVNRSTNRVLGTAQLNRFTAWLDGLDPRTTRYLFVVSAVPVLHMWPVIANADRTTAADIAEVQDELRDSWEHRLHNTERRVLLAALFAAAKRGIRICILSGDVHISAAFRMVHDKSKAVIYQLTSSALTYNKPRLLGWLLGNTVQDKGKSKDGYHYERLALYTDSNFGLIKVDPKADEVLFQLYGLQSVSHPEGEEDDRPVTHALTKIHLDFG